MHHSFLGIFFFLSVFMVICFISSYLILLVFLELMMFITFLFYLSLGDMSFSASHFVYNLIFLVMMIFEGVYGLSLMVSISRGEGSDFFIKW